MTESTATQLRLVRGGMYRNPAGGELRLIEPATTMALKCRYGGHISSAVAAGLWIAADHDDIENLAVGFLRGASRPVGTVVPDFVTEALVRPWKSDEISRACGVEPPGDEERHTAMGDALWAMDLYDTIVGGAE